MSKYIDAEAFKNHILRWGTVCEGDMIPLPLYKQHFSKAVVEIIYGLMEEVDDFPAADVQEVKHGRWILETKVFPYIDPRWTCSECGEETTETTGWGTRPKYNYCPNCGSRMDEVTERKCDTCVIAQTHNLEDDDTPCRDCEEVE